MVSLPDKEFDESENDQLFTGNKLQELAYQFWEEINANVDDNGQWVGSINEVMTRLLVPAGSRAFVIKKLYALGSLIQVERGRGGHSSVLEVARDPRTLDWTSPTAVVPKNRRKSLTKPSDYAILAERVEDIAKAQGGLHLPTIAQEISDRLSAIEVRLNALTNKGT